MMQTRSLARTWLVVAATVALAACGGAEGDDATAGDGVPDGAGLAAGTGGSGSGKSGAAGDAGGSQAAGEAGSASVGSSGGVAGGAGVSAAGAAGKAGAGGVSAAGAAGKAGAGGVSAAGAAGKAGAGASGKGGAGGGAAGKGGAPPEEPPPVVTVGTLTETTLFGVSGTSSSYSVLQGGASDGSNGYFVVMWKKPGDIHQTQLVKYNLASEKRTLVATFEPTGNKTNKLGHGNDVAYNPDTKRLVIPAWTNDQSTQPPNNQRLLRIVDPATLQIVDTKSLDVNVTNLCYANGAYLVFTGNALRTYDGDFAPKGAIPFDMKGIEDQYAPQNADRVGQGIDCDADYVYVTRWYPQKNTNRVYVANWKAQLVGAYTYDGPEGETLMHASGHRILHAFNTAASAGDVRRIDGLMFVVAFSANGGTGSMPNLRVLFGRSTPLRKNAFVFPGKIFAGWAAERASDGKWRYQKPDKSDDGWYAKGQQPSGWGYYVYKDEAIVLKSAPYGLVTMHAQWK